MRRRCCRKGAAQEERDLGVRGAPCLLADRRRARVPREGTWGQVRRVPEHLTCRQLAPQHAREEVIAVLGKDVLDELVEDRVRKVLRPRAAFVRAGAEIARYAEVRPGVQRGDSRCV